MDNISDASTPTSRSTSIGTSPISFPSPWETTDSTPSAGHVHHESLQQESSLRQSHRHDGVGAWHDHETKCSIPIFVPANRRTHDEIHMQPAHKPTIHIEEHACHRGEPLCNVSENCQDMGHLANRCCAVRLSSFSSDSQHSCDEAATTTTPQIHSKGGSSSLWFPKATWGPSTRRSSTPDSVPSAPDLDQRSATPDSITSESGGSAAAATNLRGCCDAKEEQHIKVKTLLSGRNNSFAWGEERDLGIDSNELLGRRRSAPEFSCEPVMAMDFFLDASIERSCGMSIRRSKWKVRMCVFEECVCAGDHHACVKMSACR
jgi:hypothetical protein